MDNRKSLQFGATLMTTTAAGACWTLVRLTNCKQVIWSTVTVARARSRQATVTNSSSAVSFFLPLLSGRFPCVPMSGDCPAKLALFRLHSVGHGGVSLAWPPQVLESEWRRTWTEAAAAAAGLVGHTEADGPRARNAHSLAPHWANLVQTLRPNSLDNVSWCLQLVAHHCQLAAKVSCRRKKGREIL